MKSDKCFYIKENNENIGKRVPDIFGETIAQEYKEF